MPEELLRAEALIWDRLFANLLNAVVGGFLKSESIMTFMQTSSREEGFRFDR